MNYTFLCQGDHLPAVGVLQKLLNRSGARVTPDGIFGSKTCGAVREFQRSHKLKPDGIVGKDTWPELVKGLKLPIIDCVDVFDSFQREEYLKAEKTARAAGKTSDADKLAKKAAETADSFHTEVDDIKAVGGNPLVIGGMCNGVEAAINLILGESGGDTFLVRFHGHGRDGSAGVGCGSGGPDERNRINEETLPFIESALFRLRTAFGDYGAAQFMHCDTGHGAAGRQLLHSVADLFGAPVSAALLDQYGGGEKTFRFEGPTYTAFPNGGTLQSWCKSLPDFPR